MWPTQARRLQPISNRPAAAIELPATRAAMRVDSARRLWLGQAGVSQSNQRIVHALDLGEVARQRSHSPGEVGCTLMRGREVAA